MAVEVDDELPCLSVWEEDKTCWSVEVDKVV